MAESRLNQKSSLAIAAIIMLALSGMAATSKAQTPAQLKNELASAEALLMELDDKALNCRGSFSMNLGEAAALLCDEFLRAVDGEILASYISHCKSLRSWRDQFVTHTKAAIDESTASNISDDQALELMVGIEYNCGENALQERTRYVVSTFDTLKQGSLQNQTTQQSFDRRLAEIEFQTRLDNQGQDLEQAIRQQGQRTAQSVQQQSQRLESELIRQQINNPR